MPLIRYLSALLAVSLLFTACATEPSEDSPDDTVGAAATEGSEGPIEETDATEDTAPATEVTAPATEATASEITDDGGSGAGDCSSLEGEVVTLVVPYSPGGGYDTYSRMIAPFLAEQLGADVIIENQEGAGGLLAINSLVTAPPDGTRIAIMNAVGAGGGAIADAEGVQFELTDLSYIGRVGASYHILATAADSAYASFDDVRAAEEIRYGSTGPGAADFVNGNLLRAIFDLDMEIITGFDGSEENELAVTRGDVELMTGDFDSRLPAVENGDHRALLLVGPEPDPAIPDAPALLQLDLDDRQQTLAQAQVDLLDFGRPLVAPPGVPDDILQCLRSSLKAAVDDPDLQAEAERTERPINYLAGEELEQLVQRLLDAPDEFREVLEQAYNG